ncbi:hypothetical protein CPB86DRAFT_806269 [Serendipita vermifera]|nr:hypothetical protein CPB86DRAFT_806269 [Serendipita vermifera]
MSSKHQFYLSKCEDAASKSPMCFMLGAVLVKGGKIISTGYNHYRTHYDGDDSKMRGGKPLSMHAEMHAIYNAVGAAPSFRMQFVQTNVATQDDAFQPLSNQSTFESRKKPDSERKPIEKSASVKEAVPGHASRLSTDSTSTSLGDAPPASWFSWAKSRSRDKSPDSSGAKWEQEERRRATKQRTSGITDHPTSHIGDEEEPKLSKKSTKRKGSSASEEKRQRNGQVKHMKPPGTLNNDKGAKKHTNGRSRITGSDLYVVRLTRSGTFGNAMPCWRCLEWCKWAGVKRIFHYSVTRVEDLVVGAKGGAGKTRIGRWECVKVNEARPEDCYWTQGDGKILGCN